MKMSESNADIKIRNDLEAILKVEMMEKNRDLNELGRLSSGKIHNTVLNFDDKMDAWLPESSIIHDSQNRKMTDVGDRNQDNLLPKGAGIRYQLDIAMKKMMETINVLWEATKEKFSSNKAIKKNPDMKRSVVAVMEMMLILMVMVAILASFMYTRPMYSTCDNDSINTEVTEVAQESFMSKLKLVLKPQGEISNVGCSSNRGTTNEVLPIVYFRDVSNVTVAQIYSECGTNFTLVVHIDDGDESNYTVYLAYFATSETKKIATLEKFVAGKAVSPAQVFENTANVSGVRIFMKNDVVTPAKAQVFKLCPTPALDDPAETTVREHRITLTLGKQCFIFHYEDLILIGFYLIVAFFLSVAICVIICGHICYYFNKRNLKQKNEKFVISQV